MFIRSDMPIYVPGTGRVHDTAVNELSLAMKPNDRKDRKLICENESSSGSILLAQVHETAAVKKLILNGLINLHNIAADIDAYEIIIHEGVLYLLGSNPRGMLHAVYKLQELLITTSELPDDLHLKGTFHIPRRIFHQRFNDWPGSRADIRYISHLGATHCLLTHDWQGNRRHMQGYVTSPIFPKAVDSEFIESGHLALRELINNCSDYGLGCCMWFTELPCQGGPWLAESERKAFFDHFPEEVLSNSGTYQGKVLCFGHKKVQEFYKDLLRRFFAEFPEISILFIFGLDADGEYCDPDACPRCKGVSKFEQRDRLLNFLMEEGQKVRPGLHVLTTGWEWDKQPEEFLERQTKLHEASGLYMAAEKDGWQSERQSHDLLRRARQICRQRNQLFIGYDDFHWSDETIPFHTLGQETPRDIQDFPLGVGAKVNRWFNLEVDGVFDHWGTWNEDIPCNSIACREFFLNPLADPEVVCKEIANRQFGSESGSKVFESWSALEDAHKILSNACCISTAALWPSWYRGREVVPIPNELKSCIIDETMGDMGDKRFSKVERLSNGFIYNEGGLSHMAKLISYSWQLAYPHYERATRLMEQAMVLANERLPFYSFFWSGQGIPSCKEHLQRQLIYIRSISLIGREIGIHFGLVSIFLEVNGNETLYRKQAKSLLSEDIEVCLKAADYLESLGLHGLDKPPKLIGWAGAYRNKATAIRDYLT